MSAKRREDNSPDFHNKGALKEDMILSFFHSFCRSSTMMVRLGVFLGPINIIKARIDNVP